MEAFGDELRGERERRGVSIETICSITKVSSRHMQSLEANRLGELPGGILRKGIVRSYLVALGLEEARWMQRFEEALQAGGYTTQSQEDLSQFAENVERSRVKRPVSMGLRWLGVILLAAVLAAIGWVTWKKVVRPRLRKDTWTLLDELPPAHIGHAAARCGVNLKVAWTRISTTVDAGCVEV